MARDRSRSPVTAVLQDKVGSHSNHGTRRRGDESELESHASQCTGSAVSAASLRGSAPLSKKWNLSFAGRASCIKKKLEIADRPAATLGPGLSLDTGGCAEDDVGLADRLCALGLGPSLDTGGCAEDDVGLVDRLLLEECHRCGALAELRVAFNTAWKSMWHCKAAPEAFPAWFFSALNAEVPAWSPMPGCELRGKATAAELEAPALECIRLYLPTAKQLPPEQRRLVKTPAMREAAVTMFAETAIELATEIREEWLRRYELSIMGPRADPLRIVVQLSAADGPSEAFVYLKLLGKLPPYLRPSKLKLIFKIRESYVGALLSRFKQHGVQLPGAGPFTARCWQLMLRYQTVFGGDGKLAGWHSAVSPSAMSSLVEEFGVCHELFASPLNCALPGYCSVFEDIDKFFGSSGSFFQYCRPEGPLVTYGGSYECNPPFNDELFQAVVPVLFQALTLCKLPLSIALVLPCWKWSTALAAASTSHFCRGRVDITGKDQAWMDGLQHCCKAKDRVWRSDPKNKGAGWSTVVLVLQNDAWAAHSPISAENLARHRASWGKI